MIEQIYNEYGFILEPVTLNGRQWLSSGDQLFCLVDQFNFHHQDLRELSFYCSQLMTKGHDRIAKIVPTKDGRLYTNYNGRSFVLLAFPKKENSVPPNSELLAHFHKTGREVLKQANSQNTLIPNWREFWAKRIDDLSVYWSEVEQKNERNEYEGLFLKVFPYFSGRAENAIQYLTDLLINEPVTDEPVICHHRFNGNSWGRDTLYANTPDQWVIDHPARDLAEWIRTEIYDGHRPVSEVNDIIDTYQRENKLSTAGLGFVFARLLFPIRFIENGEYVFDQSGDPGQALLRLKEGLKRIDEEERFLASFGKRYLKPLPRIDWLGRTLKTQTGKK